MENGNENKFEQWALVEIMGRVEFAGHVTEEQAFDVTLVRIDIPETSRCAAFTKLYGASAIYCITPLGEDEARAYAESLHKEPINTWRIPHATLEILGDDGLRRWDSHSSNYEGEELSSGDDDYEPGFSTHSFDDDDESLTLASPRIDSEPAQSDLGVETLLDDDVRR